ncbi:MAG: hypothetical protein NVS3B12_06080 [Acidimicrobiales bacterium]
MATPCPICGFDAASVSPSDAIAALRSYPRRFGAIIAPTNDDSSGDAWTDAHLPDGAEEAADERRRTAGTTEAGQAANAIKSIGADLRAVLVNDDPALAAPDGIATAVQSAGDPLTALDRLTSACNEVAALGQTQAANTWNRTGTRNSGPVTAVDLLRDAAHSGAHHLHEARA